MAEIERKFRVPTLPEHLADGMRLRQAYLAIDGDVEVLELGDGEAFVEVATDGAADQRGRSDRSHRD